MELLVAQLDLAWFSLFFWPEVHPQVVAAALKLMSLLLVVSPKFKATFTQVGFCSRVLR